MLTYCTSRKIKHEDAEEIVDEAFARLLKKFDQINDKSTVTLEIWLIRAVKNIILEKKRDSRKKLTYNIDDFYDICSEDNEISNIIENEGYKFCLERIHDYIGEKDWAIYEAKFVDMLDYPEISEKLNIEESTLRSSVSRIRKKLKTFIMDLIHNYLFFL